MHRLSLFILCSLWLFSIGCSAIELDSSREVRFAEPGKADSKRGKITALELQENLQRFASTFVARVYLAFQPQKDKVSPDVFHVMQSEGLVYASTALDLATGPHPEANLLDMMAFMTLTRQSLEEYWIPNVYGKAGREALQAFKKSETEIWDLAATVSTVEQRRAFMEILQDWKKENPGLQRTEILRLPGIYRISGQVGSERSKKVRGLLSQISSVVAATDQALLLSNKALFLAQRAPFLLRLHARIGAREVVSDALEEFARGNKIVKTAKDLHPLVQDLKVLSSQSEQSLKLLEGITKEMTLEKLKTLEAITTKVHLVTENLQSQKPENSSNLIVQTRMQIERLIYICLASVLIIILAWWLGYVWAKRTLYKKNN